MFDGKFRHARSNLIFRGKLRISMATALVWSVFTQTLTVSSAVLVTSGSASFCVGLSKKYATTRSR